MDIEYFKVNSDILFRLTKYPIFLLDNNFNIVCSPSSFVKFDNDFFTHYKQQSKKVISEEESFFLIYEHGYFYCFIDLKDDYAGYIWIGPILLNEQKAKVTMQETNLLKKTKLSSIEDILAKLPLLQENLTFLIQLIYQNILHKTISVEQLSTAFRQEILALTENRLQNLMSRKRELDTRHYNHNDELKLLYYIRQGDTVSARIIATNLAKGRLGQLSTVNKNIPFYAFISLTTLISRTVMDCGVDIEIAYGLNDLYIQKADHERDIYTLQTLWIEMIVDFCLLVKKTKKHEYPAWIYECINYIVINLHQPITLDMIANEVHMLSSYVSVQFKKITGIALMNYIQQRKIEEAAFLLRSTSTSILEMSTLLSFSSQAYFSTIFKQHMGVSPKIYRDNPDNHTMTDLT